MRRIVFAMVAILVTGCSDSVSPRLEPSLLSGDLTFLRFDSTAQTAAVREAGFWAVRGEPATLLLRYSDTGETYLRFDVGAGSLEQRPDGSRFAEGDSVWITVRAESNGVFAFRFQPSGLKFSAAEPAVLTLDHARTDPDIDGNGSFGLSDTVLALTAGIWKQELPILPWLRIPTLRLTGTVVRADVHDFTGFGMAVN